jgi:hypothetical protein
MSGRQDGAWARGEQSSSCSLYRRLLGPAWAQLPAAVAEMHDVADTGERVARGWVDVERGRGALARLAATLAGFPDAADAGEIEMRFEARDGIEIWTRRFGDKVFRSRQSAGRGRNADLLAEDLGPFRILMSLALEDGRLKLAVRGWQFLGLPLPLALAPAGEVYEEERDGRFHFHVEVMAPLIGPIVRYTGWLVPVETPDRVQLPAMPSSSESSALR